MKKHFNKEWIPYRINHLSWWEQELANEEEMQEGINNLKAHNYTVDYIITHCCSSSTQNIIAGTRYKPDRETDYLEYIKNNVNYKMWYFGHYHSDKKVSENETIVYKQMIRVIPNSLE